MKLVEIGSGAHHVMISVVLRLGWRSRAVTGQGGFRYLDWTSRKRCARCWIEPIRRRPTSVRQPPRSCRTTPQAPARAWGRKLLCLEPNPDAAPVVSWILQQRLDGHTLARITQPSTTPGFPARRPQTLPVIGIGLPSPGRSHRAGDPGQSRLHRPRRVEARRHRTRTARRGQPRPGLLPVRSPHYPGPVGHLHPPRHEALVSEEHFIAVQEIDSPRRLGRRAPRRQPRRSAGYLDGQAPFPQRAARRTGLQSASCPCHCCGKHAGSCLYR